MSLESFDIIVVGGGGSGLAAAVSAAEHGSRVILLEKCTQLGGTTGIAVGTFTASSTAYQQRAGIEDDPRAHAEDVARFAPAELEARNNEALRRFLLCHAAETLQWLGNMGLSFYGPSPEPPNRVPRMHNVVPGAKAYIATLQARLLRLGGKIRCETRVTELLRSNGRVRGVKATTAGQSFELHANHGVVLAAGDYSNSPELIARFKGHQFAAVQGINPHATGDGHRLAESAGGRLVNMDVTYGPEIRFISPGERAFHQLLPTQGIMARLMAPWVPLVPRFILQRLIKRLLVTWQHPENALFDDGAILINIQGKRFCDETASPDREVAIAAQADKIAYLLLDAALIDRYSQWPHFISTAPQIAYAYVNDYLRLRPDVAVAGPSLHALARRRELPADTLVATVDEYNASEQHHRRRLSGDRWCLLGPAKAYFTTTEGGAMVSERFQVLNAEGQPIRGLYAIGQNGLGGQILWGHGLHIAWAMTSGRLVGRMLAGDDFA